VDNLVRVGITIEWVSSIATVVPKELWLAHAHLYEAITSAPYANSLCRDVSDVPNLTVSLATNLNVGVTEDLIVYDDALQGIGKVSLVIGIIKHIEIDELLLLQGAA